jgi:protein-disulfide isomerase
MLLIAAGMTSLILYKELAKAEDAHVPEYPPPIEPVSLDGAGTLGQPAAAVVVIAYADFLCPSCRRFARDTFESVLRPHIDRGQVLYVYRHFPIGKLHPLAARLAEAATCAGRQGKFWQLHDIFIREPAALWDRDSPTVDTDLTRFGAEAGVDLKLYGRCLRGEAREAVHSDAGSGLALGVDSTPTLLIGIRKADGLIRVERHLRGSPGDEALDAIIKGLVLRENANVAAPAIITKVE